MSQHDRVCREDLLLFINAGLTATGQGGFYHGVQEERLSLDFLHLYIATNYRTIYPLLLAAGLNDFNQAKMLFTLLRLGAPSEASQRSLENQLIAATLTRLPPQRVYRLWERLRAAGVNNRRSRACLRGFLQQRRDLAFDAVKYRHKLKTALLHSHPAVDPEIKRFLFEGSGKKPYQTGLLETFRRAKYDSRALFELPFSVAEGLAQRSQIPRETFLEKIAPRMTEREKLRLQKAGAEAFDPARVDLVELCIYFLSLDRSQRPPLWDTVQARAREVAERLTLPPELRRGRVAAVLDNSFSSLGTQGSRRRPLALALGLHLVLAHACSDYRGVWTSPPPDLIDLQPRGSTSLGDALLQACSELPQWVLVLSDGRENAPAGGCQAIAAAWRRLNLPQPAWLHLNPVYDPEEFQPLSLGPEFPVVGVRRLEDLPTALLFAGFARGRLNAEQLQAELSRQAQALLQKGADDVLR